MTGEALDEEFWNPDGTARGPSAAVTNAPILSDSTDRGLAHLSRGKYLEARDLFQESMLRDPGDAHGLLGLALAEEGLGNQNRARSLYQTLIDTNPPVTKTLWVGGPGPRPLIAIARERRDALGGAPVQQAASPTAPTNVVATGTTDRYLPSRAVADSKAPLQTEDRNAVSRFEVLDALLKDGLITAEERATRRQANLGALLPLSQSEPAAGVSRTVPSAEEIAARLRALGRSLDLGAITVAQHTNERRVILDSLLHTAPTVRASAPGIKSLNFLQRLDWLRQADLITAAEYTAERAAIRSPRGQRAAAANRPPAPAQPRAASPRKSASSAPKTVKPAARPARPTPRAAATPQGTRVAAGIGIHLASYNNARDAEEGWREIEAKNRAALSGLSYSVTRTTVKGKGTIYRLIAGPFESRAAATRRCQQLQAANQYCMPIKG
ncbi:MAG: SPOR domain-containing protein [Magnetospiraceae bacterium]